MHMSDALINPGVGAVMYGLSAVAAGYSVKKLHDENDPKKLPQMGVLGAFIFATQMINFTIPGTGSSGHLCGGVLASAILGPYAGFLTMIGVLLLQCLLFADGGILTLGCNIWNMAFYGCFAGTFLVWLPFMKNKANNKRIIAASIIACVLTLQMGAFSVVLETLISGITELPFKLFVIAMQPIHLAIGFVEGLITSAVLVFVYNTRNELLWGICGDGESKQKLSARAVMITLLVCAVVIGGALSLIASSNPDGLEWSILKVTGSEELEAYGSVYENLESVQETTALLPDYSFKNSESAAGTSFSGILGALIIFGIAAFAGLIVRFTKKGCLVKNKRS